MRTANEDKGFILEKAIFCYSCRNLAPYNCTLRIKLVLAALPLETSESWEKLHYENEKNADTLILVKVEEYYLHNISLIFS